MRLLIRWLRRFAVLGLGIVGVWFIVFVRRITDRRLPTILALSLTYAIAAYVILPRMVRMGLKILQRKSVPSFTLTGDGLPGDPVIGEVRWHQEGERLNLGRVNHYVADHEVAVATLA